MRGDAILIFSYQSWMIFIRQGSLAEIRYCASNRHHDALVCLIFVDVCMSLN